MARAAIGGIVRFRLSCASLVVLATALSGAPAFGAPKTHAPWTLLSGYFGGSSHGLSYQPPSPISSGDAGVV
jgi:hypothetical protein